jgi:hypothetical protein
MVGHRSQPGFLLGGRSVVVEAYLIIPQILLADDFVRAGREPDQNVGRSRSQLDGVSSFMRAVGWKQAKGPGAIASWFFHHPPFERASSSCNRCGPSMSSLLRPANRQAVHARIFAQIDERAVVLNGHAAHAAKQPDDFELR